MLSFILLALLNFNTFAVPEKNVEAEWKSTIRPFFDASPFHQLTNKQGLKLYYKSFTHKKNKKAMVLVPGRGESLLKYAETIFDLYSQGLDVHIMSLQGQGESDRLLKDPHKGYVYKFSDYTQDMIQWMDEYVLPQTQGKEFYLYGHSLGAAIAVNYLKVDPKKFKKAILVTPMMEINTAPYSERTATLLAKLLMTIGQGKSYAPNNGPYRPEAYIFEGNELTQSQARFNISKFILDELPELALGGPTTRWVREALTATKKFEVIAKSIHTPILLFQAEFDKIVFPGRQNTFCQRAKNCTMIKMSGAYHDLMLEKDEVRNVAFKHMIDFIN